MQKPLTLVSALLLSAASLSGQTDQGIAKVAPSDLDALMERAVERRAASWKRLRQYVLDEREQFDLRTPTGLPLFGERRDYTWYIRDGIFVRSPVRANGVTIGERERREYEDRWIAREKRRDYRRAAKDGPPVPEPERDLSAPNAIGDFLRETIEPRFVSAAYFLDFTFEPGNYVLAGRDSIEGQEVLRVEYYPTKLFTDHDDGDGHRDREQRATERGGKKAEKREKEGDAINRRMNKVALVTLWVDPQTAEIIRYTFDNVGLDFLPGRWLVRIDELKASMEMGRPFPDVWLPKRIEFRVAITFANGTYPATFDITYHDYRLADVTSRIKKVGR